MFNLGSQVFTRTIDLLNATASAGDQNPPYRVGIIYIQGSGDNFTFDIVEEMGNVTEPVEQPPKFFTVSLFWPTVSNNLDLHIMDPQSTHVYKNNKVGPLGSLLSDILEGGDREEVYQSNAAENIVGNYTIGINYFSGSGAEDANVKFRIGNTTIEKNITLLTPIGPAGDSVVPYIVGTLRIRLSNGNLIAEFFDYQPQCVESFEIYTAWD